MTTPREHILKTWPHAYAAVADGTKRFEYRKDDRDFAVGDVLVLRQWNPAPTSDWREVGWVWKTPPSATNLMGEAVEQRVVVTYILRGQFGIPDGYCVLGIRPAQAGAESLAVPQNYALARAKLGEVHDQITMWENLVPSLEEANPERAKALGDLARLLRDGLASAWRKVPPVDMVLHCPACGRQHLDIGEFHTRVHRKHLCENTPEGTGTGCGHLWVPHDYATRGVERVDGRP